MGAQLSAIFDEMASKHQLVGQMKLAMKTTMSSNQAAEAPDSPENVGLFKKAAAEINQELG